jgi:hypothetical protein
MNQAGYTSPLKIHGRALVVGEQDFSFSAMMVEEGRCSSVLATAYRTCDMMEVKQSNEATMAMWGNMNTLRNLSNNVRFCVDATNLSAMQETFAGVIYTFPFADTGLDADHIKLVEGFLKSANEVIEPDGQIWLALQGCQFSTWGVDNAKYIAETFGLWFSETMEVPGMGLQKPPKKGWTPRNQHGVMTKEKYRTPGLKIFRRILPPRTPSPQLLVPWHQQQILHKQHPNIFPPQNQIAPSLRPPTYDVNNHPRLPPHPSPLCYNNMHPFPPSVLYTTEPAGA